MVVDGARPKEGTRTQQSSRANLILQVPLIVVLLLPLFYYPMAKGPVAGLLQSVRSGSTTSPQLLIAALVSVLVVAALAVQVVSHRRRLAIPPWRETMATPEFWAVVLLLWVAVRTLISPQPTSMQNMTVYAVATAILLLGLFDTRAVERFLRVFVYAFAAILIVTAAIDALRDGPIVFLALNPAIFAMYCVIAMCLTFAVNMRGVWRVLLLLGLYASIIVSGSRTSFVAAVLVAATGLIVTSAHPRRTGLLTLALGVVVAFVTLQVPTIGSKMAMVSISTPGLPINDSGRAPTWTATFESWLTAPIFGQGAGSSQTINAAQLYQGAVQLDHPHLESLRILHDAGVVGFLMAAVLTVLLVKALWPRRGGNLQDPLVVAGFLVILSALLIGMLDNYLVFPSLMWPGVVIVTLGLRKARSNRTARGHDEALAAR